MNFLCSQGKRGPIALSSGSLLRLEDPGWPLQGEGQTGRFQVHSSKRP